MFFQALTKCSKKLFYLFYLTKALQYIPSMFSYTQMAFGKSSISINHTYSNGVPLKQKNAKAGLNFKF